MTRYQCLNCGNGFEEDAEKPRCPQCMRRTNIEALVSKSADAQQRPAWMIPAIIAAVVAAGAGYAMWHKSATPSVSGEVPMTPLAADEVRGYLKASKVDTKLSAMFDTPDETLSEFKLSGSHSEKATQLVKKFQASSKSGAFSMWSLDAPRMNPFSVPDEVATILEKKEGRAKLYPLEVATLAVNILRDQDVPAMLAEVWRFKDENSPPDPSGRFGYYVVAVYKETVGKGSPTFYDVYAGRNAVPTEDGYRIVSDIAAIAGALSIDALHHLQNEGDAKTAMELIELARRLDPKSPNMRSVRATVLISAGGVQEGLKEMQAAAQLRPHSAQRNNTATMLVATGELDKASQEVTAALKEHPDFALAHVMLGAIHLSQGDNDLARSELAEAERLDPHIAKLPMMWSNYYLSINNLPQAVAKAKSAVKRRPKDVEVRITAARVFRAAGELDDMRRQARAALDLVAPEQQAGVREQMLQILGPSAFENPDEDLGDDDVDDEDEDEDLMDEDDADIELNPDSEFQLGSDSSLLGGGGKVGSGSSLLGDDTLGGGGLGGGGLGGGGLGGGGLGGGLKLGGGGGGGLKLDL